MIAPSIEALRGLSPPELLSVCRRAWWVKVNAEGELARLARYSRETPAMKVDRRRLAENLDGANATLSLILGGSL